MKKVIKLILVVLLVVLVIMQFIRPEKYQGGYESVALFEAETKPSQAVAGILKANCYDCHSNHTQYPWYSEIAPISYFLKDHIDEGKEHFNVSAWDSYSIKKKDHKMEELVEEVEEGEMPLDSYTWIHGNLTEEDRELLIQWAQMVRISYQNDLKVSDK